MITEIKDRLQRWKYMITAMNLLIHGRLKCQLRNLCNPRFLSV